MAKSLEELIAAETDIKKLSNYMKNAENQKRDDIYQLAFRRHAELAGESYNTPLEKDFWSVIAAYELRLTEKNKRTTRATRTRQKVKNKGLKQCLIDWAMGKETTMGFDLLVKNGLYELTGEYLVIKYADQFDEEVVLSAQLRLAEYDISPPREV